jgi:glyoxylase I family protein
MGTTRINHINFHAERELLDALRDFYRDVVDLREGPRPAFAQFGYWLYAGDEPIVHLSEAAPGEACRTDVSTTFNHVAFQCTDRPEAEAKLQRMGVPYRTAVARSGVQVQLFIRDPAGNQVELNFPL